MIEAGSKILYDYIFLDFVHQRHYHQFTLQDEVTLWIWLLLGGMNE